MKRALMALAGGAFLLSAGCPVQDMAGLPEWSVYGKLKADFSIDTEDTLPGSSDYVWYVDNATGGGQVSMSPRDSRFGANMGDPEMDAVTAKVEVDFQSSAFLMRHVFVKLDLGGGASLIAGQTSDVFSPLCPSTLNWTVGWYAGNVGHRSPQFRFEWAPEDGPVGVQVALSDPDETDETPDLQARVAFKAGDVADMGASIVMARDDNQEDAFGLAVDFSAKLGDRIGLKGEWFVGKNLVNYYGNIDRAPTGGRPEIGTTGLWAHIVFKPSDALTVNAGMTVESNDDSDIAGSGWRDTNSSIFGNFIFHLNEDTDFGLEVTSWKTSYEGDTSYGNFRIQGSVIMEF